MSRKTDLLINAEKENKNYMYNADVLFCLPAKMCHKSAIKVQVFFDERRCKVVNVVSLR